MKKNVTLVMGFIILLVFSFIGVVAQEGSTSNEEPEDLTLEQIFLGLQEIPIEELAVIIETGDNHELLMMAIQLLSNNNSPESIALLIKALEIGQTNVQTANGQVTNDYWDVRVEACIALGNMGTEEAVEPLINALIEDSDPIVKTYAALALGQIGDERAVEPLINMLAYFQGSYTSTTAPLMYGIITALGDIGSPDAFGVLLQISQGPYPSFIRQSAIAAIKKIQFASSTSSDSSSEEE